MTKLSRAEVEYIAELAKLTLSEAEKTTFQEQLSSILEYAELLQQVDTEGIPPSASALPLNNVMRPDLVRPSLPTTEALANAPAADDGYFKVRPVLD
ncbi:MAG TPA: Asp-tRNA(Asn)/Glu-tRNA(Gln) amidotransferase subunit GatC [Anaerolineae bacterium]|nr:Asp-tRNA(Asn)/Glu-tRNA(Gln) amidotransferase subunit GatC [Anaerolineae bacterium]